MGRAKRLRKERNRRKRFKRVLKEIEKVAAQVHANLELECAIWGHDSLMLIDNEGTLACRRCGAIWQPPPLPPQNKSKSTANLGLKFEIKIDTTKWNELRKRLDEIEGRTNAGKLG